MLPPDNPDNGEPGLSALTDVAVSAAKRTGRTSSRSASSNTSRKVHRSESRNTASSVRSRSPDTRLKERKLPRSHRSQSMSEVTSPIDLKPISPTDHNTPRAQPSALPTPDLAPFLALPPSPTPLDKPLPASLTEETDLGDWASSPNTRARVLGLAHLSRSNVRKNFEDDLESIVSDSDAGWTPAPPAHSSPRHNLPDLFELEHQPSMVDDFAATVDMLPYPIFIDIRNAITRGVQRHWLDFPESDFGDRKVDDTTRATRYVQSIFDALTHCFRNAESVAVQPWNKDESAADTRRCIANLAINFANDISKNLLPKAPYPESMPPSQTSAIESSVPRATSVPFEERPDFNPEIGIRMRDDPVMNFFARAIRDLAEQATTMSGSLLEDQRILLDHRQRISALEGNRGAVKGSTPVVQVRPTSRHAPSVALANVGKVTPQALAGVQPTSKPVSTGMATTPGPARLLDIPTVTTGDENTGGPQGGGGGFGGVWSTAGKGKGKGKSMAQVVKENPKPMPSAPTISKANVKAALNKGVSDGYTDKGVPDEMRVLVVPSGELTSTTRRNMSAPVVKAAIENEARKRTGLSRFTVTASHWNQKGNLVISFPPSTNIKPLFDHQEDFIGALRLPIPSMFRYDVAWSKFKIDSVHTGIDGNVYTKHKILLAIREAFPELRDAQVTQGPNWIGNPKSSRHKSINVSFEDADGSLATSVLGDGKQLRYMFGSKITVSKWNVKLPLRVCERCCSYDHTQEWCRQKSIRCGICSLAHATHNHRKSCKKCEKEAIVGSIPCPHPPKCAVCEGDHTFNSPSCQIRKRYRPTITDSLRKATAPELLTFPPKPVTRAPISSDPNAIAPGQVKPVGGEPKGWAELAEEESGAGPSGLSPIIDVDQFLDRSNMPHTTTLEDEMDITDETSIETSKAVAE